MGRISQLSFEYSQAIPQLKYTNYESNKQELVGFFFHYRLDCKQIICLTPINTTRNINILLFYQIL
jgi:hypothetical protein